MIEGVIQDKKDELQLQLEDLERDKIACQKAAAEIALKRQKEEAELKTEQEQTEEAKVTKTTLEGKLVTIKERWKNQLKELKTLEKENAKLNTEFTKEKVTLEKKINQINMASGLVESQLDDAKYKLGRVQEANKWTRHFHEKNVKAVGAEAGKRVEGEAQFYRYQYKGEEDEAKEQLQLIEKDIKDEKEAMRRDVEMLEKMTQESEKLQKEIDVYKEGISRLNEVKPR